MATVTKEKTDGNNGNLPEKSKPTTPRNMSME